MNSYEQITLKDGRKLAFTIYGAKQDGKPIFYHHGWPSSRLEGASYEAAATQLNGRLIAIDRPGVGRSDIEPKRSLLDWPDDLCQLADQLGIDKFYVLGDQGEDLMWRLVPTKYPIDSLVPPSSRAYPQWQIQKQRKGCAS